MKKYSVVARYKDGSLIKGKTSDFSPLKSFFHVSSKTGESVMVDIEKLKAIFFVRDVDQEWDSYRNIKDLGGEKIRVHFNDGEELIGYALEYTSKYHGFFVTPDNKQSNNIRIFVVTSATEKITFS